MFKNSKNQLLVRDDVGKARPSVRDLPIFGHSYGHRAAPDKEGVSACKLRKVKIMADIIVLTNWTFHKQTAKKEADKDFKELNRMAIRNKATTSDRQYEFR
jgi:hypothetical protein